MKSFTTFSLLALLVVLYVVSAQATHREKRLFGKAFKAVTGGIKKVASAVKDTVDDSADAVKDVADDVKDGVKDAAKYTAKVGKKIGKGAASLSKKAYRDVYNNAKKGFSSIKGLAGKVDFDQAVDILTNMIDSELTNSICEFSCIGAAVYVLGPAGEMYGEIACPSLCSASLAKLEDVAG